VVEPRFRWIFPGAAPSPLDAPPTAGGRIPARLVGLFAARGVATEADAEQWFGDPLAGLHDPAALPDADRTLARLSEARDRGQGVLVFGDFDADGLTGLAIDLALRRFGVDVVPYVPSRLEEGHGLSLAASTRRWPPGPRHRHGRLRVHRAAEIAQAAERGIDTIVTDHHRVPAVHPPALRCQPASFRRDPRTGGWPAVASPSRSPSSCWRTCPVVPGRST
jgi:hypothetical protein